MKQKKPAHKNFGLLMTGLGLALGFGGWSIYANDGTLYFTVVGIMIVACGVLINRGMKVIAYLFVATFAVMVVWSFQEEGFVIEKLFTRLGMALIILVYIFASKIYQGLE